MQMQRNSNTRKTFLFHIIFTVIFIGEASYCFFIREEMSPLFWLLLIAYTIASVYYVRKHKILLNKIEQIILDNNIFDGNLSGMNADELADLIEEALLEGSAADTLKVEAELHALQNQINPHFLYNTLEAIRSRALIQGNQDVADMVEALAKQFRYCVNSSGEMTSLENELDNIHNYLLLQRYRYGERFHYQEKIDKDTPHILNCKMPIMTLQPIIENALIHGINPKADGGNITLRVRASANRVHISVEDDGVGMSNEQLQRIRTELKTSSLRNSHNSHGSHDASKHIAIKNVNQRITFYFGEQYGLDIASVSRVGTSVFITLPLINKTDQDD